MAFDNSVDQKVELLYEKEVQAYLAQNLHLLGESSLELVQIEHPIGFGKDSGRIDILAKDANADYVVIEVKRGIAGRSAVGQVQSYMGSLLAEFPGKKVRGLLVAMGLDDAARSALLVTTNIKVFEFKTRFEFKPLTIFKPESTLEIQRSRAEIRADYWESLGGSITDQVLDCTNCGKLAKIISVGTSLFCGVCGKATH